MASMWVAAADCSVCRIFAEGDPAGALQELEVPTHPEVRLRERELVFDPHEERIGEHEPQRGDHRDRDQHRARAGAGR